MKGNAPVKDDARHDTESWTEAHRELWRRIEAHPFEPDGHALGFVRRLARDRDWTLEYARGAVREYRRFCFLAATSQASAMTPSEEVDEVWHLHLTYTRDYWDTWCGEVLGAKLHHDPTQGGPHEQVRFRSQYAETLARYEAYFGLPDARFWPASHLRFSAAGPRFRVVDRERALVIPRPAALSVRSWFARSAAALGFAPPLPAVALVLALPGRAMAGIAERSELPGNPLDWPAGPFLALFVGLAAASFAAMGLLRWRLRDTGQPGQSVGLGVLELAYLAGGTPRTADTVAVGFLAAGAAGLDPKRSRIVVAGGADCGGSGGADLPRELAGFRRRLSGSMTRKAFAQAVSGEVERVRDALVQRGLAPTPDRLRQIRTGLAALILPVLALGAAKVAVGSSRGKPVGILLVLLVLTVLAACLLAFARQPYRTTAGDRALAEYGQRHSRTVRAPRDGELVLAFALAGPVALLGTPFEGYRSLINGAGSSGDGSSSGCGGGGDSGGGCGGCSGA